MAIIDLATAGSASTRTDTALAGAKLDPRKWLSAAHLLMTARKGISAMRLQHGVSVSCPTV